MSKFNNLAQTSNFEFGCPDLDFSTKYVTQCNIPGLQLSHFETGSRRGAKIHVQGDTVTYNDLSVTYLMDEEFDLFFQFYDKFMSNFNPEDGTFSLGDFNCYVQINDNQGDPIFRVDYYNCKLASYDDISLDSQNDQEFFTFNVNYSYDYYKITRLNHVISPK